MKIPTFLLAVALMSGCTSTDWRAAARASVESACRSNTHCAVQCDPRSPLTVNDPACQSSISVERPANKGIERKTL